MLFSSKRRKVERLIGAELPERLEDLRYFRWQPGSDLSFYVVYVRFGASRDEFVGLAARAGMTLSGGGGDADLYLPAAWEADHDVSLDWWEPSTETPADSAAKRLGSNGWVVAKHERGRVYLIATDTGRDELESGPP